MFCCKSKNILNRAVLVCGLSAFALLSACEELPIDMDVREAQNIFGDKNPIGVFRWENGDDKPASACTAFVDAEKNVWTAGHCVDRNGNLLPAENLYVYFKNPAHLKPTRFRVQQILESQRPLMGGITNDYAKLRVLLAPDEKGQLFESHPLEDFGSLVLTADYQRPELMHQELKSVHFSSRQGDLFRFDLRMTKGFFLDPADRDLPDVLKALSKGMYGSNIKVQVHNSGAPVICGDKAVAVVSQKVAPRQPGEDFAIVQKIYDPKAKKAVAPAESAPSILATK